MKKNLPNKLGLQYLVVLILFDVEMILGKKIHLSLFTWRRSVEDSLDNLFLNEKPTHDIQRLVCFYLAPPPRAGYDTMSIFKQSKSDLRRF